MALKRWTGSAFADVTPNYWNGSAFVKPSSCYIWNGSSFVQVWTNGAMFNDPLSSLSAFSETHSGSGIAISSGQAVWNGTSDGGGTAIYNQPILTDYPYVKITVGTSVTSRQSGIILNSTAVSGTTVGSYYALAFANNGWGIVKTSGRWGQSSSSSVGSSVSTTISAGAVIEFWVSFNQNFSGIILDDFNIRINGGSITKVASAERDSSIKPNRYCGFGMQRSLFANSSAITDITIADAAYYGLAG